VGEMGSVSIDREKTQGHRNSSHKGQRQAAETWAGSERELLPEMSWEWGFKHLPPILCSADTFPNTTPGLLCYPPEGIRHGFGESGGDGAQVKKKEVEQKKVHGGVEAVVTGYGGDDEAVAQEGSQVDAQEEPEVQELQLPCVCECQKEELGDGAAVGHLLCL